MHTYDYHGWTVSDEDVLYHKLIEKDINIIDADKDRVKEIIDHHVTNQTVALDIGCHYGFMTEFLSKHFVAVHAFDFDNDIVTELEVLNMNRRLDLAILKSNLSIQNYLEVI